MIIRDIRNNSDTFSYDFIENCKLIWKLTHFDDYVEQSTDSAIGVIQFKVFISDKYFACIVKTPLDNIFSFLTYGIQNQKNGSIMRVTPSAFMVHWIEPSTYLCKRCIFSTRGFERMFCGPNVVCQPFLLCLQNINQSYEGYWDTRKCVIFIFIFFFVDLNMNGSNGTGRTFAWWGSSRLKLDLPFEIVIWAFGLVCLFLNI